MHIIFSANCVYLRRILCLPKKAQLSAFRLHLLRTVSMKPFPLFILLQEAITRADPLPDLCPLCEV